MQPSLYIKCIDASHTVFSNQAASGTGAGAPVELTYFGQKYVRALFYENSAAL